MTLSSKPSKKAQKSQSKKPYHALSEVKVGDRVGYTGFENGKLFKATVIAINVVNRNDNLLCAIEFDIEFFDRQRGLHKCHVPDSQKTLVPSGRGWFVGKNEFKYLFKIPDDVTDTQSTALEYHALMKAKDSLGVE